MDVEAVGWVASSRRDASDDDWGDVVATITLDGAFGTETLVGLDGFSHVEVVYRFDRVSPDSVERGARHPRENPAWPAVGIFAQRARKRPNRLGVSVCRLLSVEGRTLTVRGLDAIDGTPVLDVKPYMAEFGPRGRVRQPTWSHELMAGYWRTEVASPGEALATRRSYDAVADRYADAIGDELVGKPLDRALLAAVAELSAPGPVVDVGCGPGHVAADLARRGSRVIATDLSPEMSALARRATGGSAFAADMTAMPLATSSVGGVVCLYAVIHLGSPARAAAYRELARVLRPEGVALVAFHTSDAEVDAGGAKSLDEWWGSQVDLVFRFLDPLHEQELLEAAGLSVVGRLDRRPVPGVEHPSDRSYLLARKPAASAGEPLA